MRRARRIPAADGLQREAALAIGGLRAVLLQLAHPAVGHGVADHSAFAADPLARLTATLRYVYVVADGDPALVGAVAREVGRRHASVRSTGLDPVDYDARDPDLQRFVAATIHDTAVLMAERVWGPLPVALETELLVRNGRIATALGVPEATWPTSPDAFRAAFATDLARLRFDAATRSVARELFAARQAPLPVRIALPLLVAATAPLLPGGLAEQLGLRPQGVRSRLATALLGVLIPVYRRLPAAVRQLPARRIVADAHRAERARPAPAAVGAAT